MNAIVGFSQLLNKSGLSEEKRQYFVDLIQSNSDQLLTLLDNIIELSDLETGHMKLDIQACQLNILLDKLYRENLVLLEESGKSGEIELSFIPGVDDKEFQINTDQLRLGQIIERLLDNAIKFTSFAGEITVGTELVEGEALFFVTDTGLGIPPESRQRVFDRFARLESADGVKGTGIGLAFCKLAVEAHRGRIWVESEVGYGATFYFTLPLEAETEENLASLETT